MPRCFALPEALDDLLAAHVGQEEIEEDELGAHALGGRQSLGPGGGDVQVAGDHSRQGAAQDDVHDRVVFDRQNAQLLGPDTGHSRALLNEFGETTLEDTVRRDLSLVSIGPDEHLPTSE